MIKGKIKWFNELSGHGFIEVPAGKDVYVHYTSILAPKKQEAVNLINGTPVKFDLIETEQGPEAFNVEILANTPPL